MFESSGRAAQRRRWRCQAAGHRGDRPTFAITGTSEGFYNFDRFFDSLTSSFENMILFPTWSIRGYKWLFHLRKNKKQKYAERSFFKRPFHRLGDLSEEEQRSVVALICNKVPGSRKLTKFEDARKNFFSNLNPSQGPVVPAPAVGQTFTVTAHVCQVDSRQVGQTL